MNPIRCIFALAVGTAVALPASASALTVSLGTSPAGAVVATDSASLDDDIGLGNIGGQIQIADLAGVTPIAPCVAINPSVAACPQTDPFAINLRFDTGGGDDVVGLQGVHAMHGTGVVMAGAGHDVVGGGSLRDFLDGQSGDDVVNGRGNHDDLSGGPGADRVSGNKGDDVLSGDAGNDWLSGGPGRERLIGGTGRDICIGGPGALKLITCEIVH